MEDQLASFDGAVSENQNSFFPPCLPTGMAGKKLQFNLQPYRAMIRSVVPIINKRIFHGRHDPVVHQEMINAPPDILITAVDHKAPVGILNFRWIKMPVRIHYT